MLGPVQRWFQFQVERALVRGASYRLLLIVLAIGVISLVSGSLLHLSEVPRSGQLFDSVWWAFLRLTDPGYLGDDQGTLRRALSTALTVAGYVLFLGALVATMTQALNDQIRRLERGFTPVAMKNHIVVIGWNASTPELLAELTEPSHGMDRFLEQYGLKGLRIAVLAEEVGPELEEALRERLGARYRAATTVLRSGSALQAAHLERVDYRNAAVIVFSIPEQGRGKLEASDDAQLTKSIVTLARGLERGKHVPVVVASVADPLKLEVIRASYPRARVELFATAQIVGRLLVRCIRDPGLLRVMDELFSQQYGSEIYVHRVPELDGVPFSEVLWRYERAIVLGTVSPAPATAHAKRTEARPIVRLVRSLDERIEKGASLVVIADDGELRKSTRPAPKLATEAAALTVRHESERSVLLVGWNHQLCWMLSELEAVRGERWRVLVASSVPIAERQAALDQAGLVLSKCTVEHRQIDPTAPRDLAALPLCDYQSLVVPASDRLESAEDADARSLLVCRLLRARLHELSDVERHMLVELRDPANTDLFDSAEIEPIPTALLATHILAQVALRPEVRPVLDQLLSSDGPEFEMLEPSALGLHEQRLSFAELMLRGAEHGVVVVGVQLVSRGDNGGIWLNPPRDELLALGKRDRVVVLERPSRASQTPSQSVRPSSGT